MRRHASDEGFTLVEVVVAVAIFVMVTAAALTALIAALNTVRENADRAQAASIARTVVEDLQAQGANALLDRLGADLTSPLDDSAIVFEEAPYTITVTAQWASINQLVDPCVQGELSARTYLLASVSVSGGSLISPQVVDGVIPRLKSRPASDEPGSIAIRVVDSAGNGVSGVSVRVSSEEAGYDSDLALPGRTTDETGCLVIDNLAASVDYVVAVAKAGFVTPELAPDASITVAVDPAINTPVGFVLDQPRTVVFENIDDSYAVNSAFAVSIFPVVGLGQKIVLGAPEQLFPDTYQAWLGNCPDSGDRQVTVPVTPLQPGQQDDSITASLVGNLVQLLVPPKAAVEMRHAPLLVDDTTLTDLCRGLRTVDLAVMDDSGGILSFNVPTGEWVFAGAVDAGVVDDTVALFAASPSPCSIDLGLARASLALAKDVKSTANTAATAADDTNVTVETLQQAWAEVALAAQPEQGLGDDTVTVGDDFIIIRPVFGSIVAEHLVRLAQNADDTTRAYVDDTAGTLLPLPPTVIAPTCPAELP